MVRVLDCPGIESSFLDKLASEAAAEFGLTTASQADSHAMCERKRCEIELADVVLVCSELQAQMLRDTVPSAKPQVVPLWVDTRFWQPVEHRVASGSWTLRALFVGKINLRKGVPYLLKAVVACGGAVALTLVGSVDDEMKPFLKSCERKIKLLPPCTKTELRKHYHEHDVLALPSLGDSFGFVAMEAMACGLPVIVSENCGAPVPDPAWRVPVMDCAAIAERLEYYAADRQALERDGQIAYQFVRPYTPERYREQIKGIYRQLLG
jgi:glycosyltransferase involved in cell wall biosynthesis